MEAITPEQLADAAATAAKKDPKVRALIQDVRMYDGLHEHAGWRHLRNKIAEQQDRFAERLARRILSGREVVDQREIDYQRGFIEGATFVIERPEVAETQLETVARVAWMLGSAETAEGEMSPYG